MAKGLDVSGVVRVSVTLQPIAAQERNFGTGIIVGSSNVIDVTERKRLYTSAEAIATDFGVNSPEAKAATLYFSQEPQPEIVYVGRWAQAATAGLLRGATLSPSQRALGNFTAVTNGSMKISVDGTERTLTGLNFSAALNLNGVAQIVQDALSAVSTGATVKWDSVLGRFTVESGTTGTSSSVSYATSHTTGTDVSSLLHLTAADASAPVVGVDPETLPACISLLADMDSRDYAYLLAVNTSPDDATYLATAAVVEGLGQSHLFGITIQNANVLDPTTSADLGSQLKDSGFKRTYWQYSATNAFAHASFFGRAATVDFNGADTTITMMFKKEPGVIAETITESQAATLKAKNGNVFVNYNNDTAILQNGVMSNGYYFDEVHNLDWLQNTIQTAVYNLLYTRTTKVPQTDAGMEMIKAVIKSRCYQAVTNGMLAPGVWTGPKIGPLNTGDVLENGFFVYAPPIATQSEADRAARKTVPFQVAVKLAGAVHAVIISITANR